MGLFDSRAITGGLAGACVLTLLRQTQRRALPGPAVLRDAPAAAAYYSLAGTSSRPVLAGAVLGVAAGLIFPRRRSAPAAVTSIALHAIAGVTAGAVYAWLSDENWPAEDFGEAFFP